MRFIAVVVAGGLFAAAAFGQVPPAQGGQGLDALDRDRVLGELAGRDLQEALRHAFERRGVPEERRALLLARASLNRLETDTAIPRDARRRLVQDVVAATAGLTARADDPDVLLEQAQLLITRGVEEEARLLEYFGDNPDLRRHLRPVADAVADMFARAIELYATRADDAEERISGPNDPNVQRWRDLTARATAARNLATFAEYYRVLGKAPGDPDRARAADALLSTVARADNEQNPRRNFVRNYLGKVALARGGDDGLARARELLEAVADSSRDPGELFDAYYFLTVAEIEARRVDEARRRFQTLRQWFDGRPVPEREALMLVLEHRVEDAAARFGPEAQRQQAADRATQLLVRLVDEHEGFRGVVTEQLLARIDADADLSTLSPLVLDAMVDRGRREALELSSRREGVLAEPDRNAIEQGVDAAEALLARDDTPAAAAARAAILRGLMLDVLGRRLDAAEAFVATADLPGVPREQQLTALRRAIGIVDEARRSPDENVRVRADAVEGRLLPVLVGEPFNDLSRAFDLANRHHRTGRLDEAAEIYALVPDNDPRLPDAAFLRLLAKAARLGELPRDDPRRADLARQIPDLAADTRRTLEAAASAATGRAADAYRERALRTRILLARLELGELSRPERALDLLEGIERDAAGLAAADEIVAAALPVRFQATAAAGRVEETTRDLLALLENSPPRQGLALITQFRQTLNRALDRAEAAGDSQQVGQILRTRAAVTPRLVEWIESARDPEYRRFAYNFRRFDAETQKQAAQATTGADRERLLRRALDAFSALESPDNLERYRTLLPDLTDAQRQQVAYDREVLFALANVHYELGEYEEARQRYARLLADRALGDATRFETQDGVTRPVPNDDFWELYYKFIRANLSLGQDPSRMARELQRLQVAHGDAVGGTRWRDEYAALGTELFGAS